MRMRFYS